MPALFDHVECVFCFRKTESGLQKKCTKNICRKYSISSVPGQVGSYFIFTVFNQRETFRTNLDHLLTIVWSFQPSFQAILNYEEPFLRRNFCDSVIFGVFCWSKKRRKNDRKLFTGKNRVQNAEFPSWNCFSIFLCFWFLIVFYKGFQLLFCLFPHILAISLSNLGQFQFGSFGLGLWVLSSWAIFHLALFFCFFFLAISVIFLLSMHKICTLHIPPPCTHACKAWLFFNTTSAQMEWLLKKKNVEKELWWNNHTFPILKSHKAALQWNVFMHPSDANGIIRVDRHQITQTGFF